MNRFLSTVAAFEGEGTAEFRAYLDWCKVRLIRTLQLLIAAREPRGKLLELGASPYFLTQLIERFTEYEITTTNYFGKRAEAVELHEQTVGNRTYRYDHFNVEEHRFPYDDATFDVVLCCEIIEHLTVDPTHMITEAHRVLRKDGVLIVTTPNVLRLENVLRLLRGRNIYDPYSGYGPYGRHPREWTPAELDELLQECGFEVVAAELLDLRPSSLIERLITNIFPNRREQIIVVARQRGEMRCAYPASLYRSLYPVLGIGRDAVIPGAMHKVARSRLDMGRTDLPQIGTGWHHVEAFDPPPFRWTAAEAVAYLWATGKQRRLVLELRSGSNSLGKVDLTISAVGRSATFADVADVWQTIEVALPDAPRGVVQVLLRVDPPRIPASLGVNADTRELGVMVRSLALET